MSELPAVQRMVEQALENRGLVSLEFLLAEFVTVDRLRALARERGLSPKGFRIDAAPARAVAQALVRDLDPELLALAASDLVARLKPGALAAPVEPSAPRPQAPTPAAAAEIERVRSQLAATVAVQQRFAARVAEFESRSAQQAQQIASLRGDLALARAQPTASGRLDRDVVRKLHEAEAELEVLARGEEDYRRRLAEQLTTIRTLEQRVEELEALVPKNRRRRPSPAPPPAPVERFRVPHFTPEFYRSLGGREQRSVDAAFEAVWRFATAGYSYPGLEVKQLEGIDLWSMRAGIKVRVYFRPRPDGGFDVLSMGDREDQDTLLRRHR